MRPKPFNYDDSSGAEIAEDHMERYDLAERLANVEDPKKKNSILLQSLGVEMLYSKKVNEEYYQNKDALLSGPSTIEQRQEWLGGQLRNNIIELADDHLLGAFSGSFEKRMTRLLLSIGQKEDYILFYNDETLRSIQSECQTGSELNQKGAVFVFNSLLEYIKEKRPDYPVPYFTEETDDNEKNRALGEILNEFETNKDYPFNVGKPIFPELFPLYQNELELLENFLTENPNILLGTDLHGFAPRKKAEAVLNKFIRVELERRCDDLAESYDEQADEERQNPEFSDEEYYAPQIRHPFGKNVDQWMSNHQGFYGWQDGEGPGDPQEPGEGMYIYISDNDQARAELIKAISSDIAAKQQNQNEELTDQKGGSLDIKFQGLAETIRDHKKLSEEIKIKGIAVAQGSQEKLVRKTLEDDHSFNSKNFTEFLVNLRLSNRSQKRRARQLKDEEINGEFKMVDDQESIRFWDFDKAGRATEKQTITTGDKKTGKKKRSDWVLNAGSYVDVYGYIENMKRILGKDDEFVIDQFRNIIAGKGMSEEITNPNMRKNLISMTYLLFGTETARNPGQLVAVQMVFDLILEGREVDNWKNALDSDVMVTTTTTFNKNKNEEESKDGRTGGYMPMSMKLVVDSARFLQNEYSDKLPFPYRYDDGKGAKGRKDELMKREANIVDRWAKLKIEKKELDPNYNDQQLIDLIRGQQEKWYGVSFEEKRSKSSIRPGSHPLKRTKQHEEEEELPLKSSSAKERGESL